MGRWKESFISLETLWAKGETIHEVCPRTFRSTLELMKRYPFLRFSQSSAQAYERMERYYPEIFEEIKRSMEEGRWEVVGDKDSESKILGLNPISLMSPTNTFHHSARLYREGILP